MIFKTTKGGGALTHSLSKKNKPTEADIAYEVLNTHGTPMYYQKLISEVLKRLGISPGAARIAEALTKINLDTRFVFLGQGEWGLRVWEPAKSSRRSAALTLMNKSSEEDERLDIDQEELEDELLEEETLELEETFEDPIEPQPEEKW